MQKIEFLLFTMILNISLSETSLCSVQIVGIEISRLRITKARPKTQLCGQGQGLSYYH